MERERVAGGDVLLLVWIQQNITSGPFFLSFDLYIDIEKLWCIWQLLCFLDLEF